MKKLAVWIAAGCLLIAGGAVAVKKFKKTPATNGETVVTAARRDIASTVSVTGVLRPRIEIALTSAKKGQVDEILVHEGDYVRTGQTLATVSSEDRINLLNAAARSVEQARAAGDAAALARAEDELRVAEAAYQRVPIISPIDGLVTMRGVEPGQKVDTATTIVQVSDNLVVKVLVDETDIGRIREGMRGSIVVDAYPDDTLVGRIIKIAYTATTESNVTSYEVLLAIESGGRARLKSGMTAEVTIAIQAKKDVVVLPTDAVKTRGGRSTAQVLDAAGTAQTRPVTTGIEDENGIEIVAGVAAGEKVVVKSKKSSTASSDRTSQRSPMMMGARGMH